MLRDPHPRSAHRAPQSAGLVQLTRLTLTRPALSHLTRRTLLRPALLGHLTRRTLLRPAVPGHLARRTSTRRPSLGQLTRRTLTRRPWLGQATLVGQALARQALARGARARQALVIPLLTRHSPPAHLRPAPARHPAAHRGPPHPPAGQAPASVPRLPRQRAGGTLPTAVGVVAMPKARGAVAASKARRQLRPGDAQQALQLVMSALAATIIVSVVGLSGFFIIAEERRGPVAESAAPPGVPAAISSREVDGAPLTLGEVFPEGEIRLTREAAPYRITVTHSDTDCRGAATEELGVLVASQGCSQVVRAALVAPLGGYHVTAGIFNLAEAGEAALVSDRAGTLVEAGRGTFAALGEVEATPVQVGWHDRGHYLLYCVIARPDGQVVADDDPFAEQITADLVEHYLGEQILGRRTLDP